MKPKRESSSGRFVRVVPTRASGGATTTVTIVQPKQRPTSTSLSEIRKALREVHAAPKAK